MSTISAANVDGAPPGTGDPLLAVVAEAERTGGEAGTGQLPFARFAVTLGPAAGKTRRKVGPVAWALLECLAESAELRDGGTVSQESVRGVAKALGLAKDTVVRALRRLSEAGLVERVDTRGERGRFGRGHYRLTIDADVLDLELVGPARPAQPSRRSPSTTSRASQLSLLDLSS